MIAKKKSFDVFIAHASEDKDAFVRPFAESIQSIGVDVWYDEFSLHWGDSLSEAIDRGLANSRYGIVVISPDFIQKAWPRRELRGLVQGELAGKQTILPIWHGVTRQQVWNFSPPLADIYALNTFELSAAEISIWTLESVRKDLCDKYAREDLERLASGKAMVKLQAELNRTHQKLKNTCEALSEYRCPSCGAHLAIQTGYPADASGDHWGELREYECGLRTDGSQILLQCPTDPKFPKFEDFELHFQEFPDKPILKWQCTAFGKTSFAREIHLPPGFGKTRKAAEHEVRSYYHQFTQRTNT